MVNEHLQDIAKMYGQRLQLLQNEEKPKIGWLSISTPEEIIYAAGMIPYRITGETRPSFPKASAAMHRNICPYVLSSFEEALDGVHDFAAGAIIVDACDARRKLHDVWKHHDDSKFLHLLGFPKAVNPETKNYFKNQLRRLVEALETKFQCEIKDDKLKEAIQLCNETRSLLSEIYTLRRTEAAPISCSQVIDLVKASMTGLRKDLNRKLSRLIESFKSEPGPIRNKGHRVLLTGSYFDHENIAAIFEANGADIVCEDVSTGVKYFEGQVDLMGDPFDALVDYYLGKATCARMTDAEKRFQHLWDLVEQYDIQAVAYFTLNFCDNNLFDYPFIKKELNERGIPVLLIEAERSVINIEQIKTRTVAFLESQMGYGNAV